VLYALYFLLVVISLLLFDNIKLRSRIRTDAMTSAVTRTVFESTLVRWRKSKSKFAVIYIDCDGFKRVNDAYGHKAGDHVLYAVVEFLKEIVRPSDMVARLGGDEFAILLRDCKSVQLVVERIQVFKYIGVTLSCGWATSDEYDPLTLADTRMYEAKRASYQ
jgi:diguanylate cyclase (GGDEF)-like protein